MRTLFITAILGWFSSVGMAQTLSPLFARGYTVVPEPQRVSLGTRDFTFGRSWQLKVDKSVAKGNVAVEVLREDLAARFNVKLGAHGRPDGILSLRIAPESVHIGNALDNHKGALEDQAYRIDLNSGSVTITANAAIGLFYGVETLIQLLKPDLGTLWLPEGIIEDWPDLQLRLMYWDDNHHLDRVYSLKRDLRQAAFYKVNGFMIKLDGHFQYKSAPAVVEPYALTPAELQELTNYGLHYHIQIIPYLDGPAHLAFILKHPEYSKLRAFPDSNYEMCVANPDSYQLLESMYQDLLDANKGVKYFYVSMDEPYYLGLANNSQCNEVALKNKLGSAGQIFSQFLGKTGAYLHARGRTPMFWGAFPLKPADVPSLPTYLLANIYGPDIDPLDQVFHQRDFQQILSAKYINEGDSRMFPQYFVLPQSERLHSENYHDTPNVVDDIVNKISFDPSRSNTNLIGEVTAGWGDKGINPETFWLGYIAGTSAGWHPGSPNPQELESAFYSLFYGVKAINMARIYQMMSEQDQSWSDSWDTVSSNARKPIWGGSYGRIFKTPKPLAKDQTLPLPPAPDSNLKYSSTWSNENAKRIALASKSMRDNDTLLGLIDENIQRSQFNRYNLEVYLTIANLYRQSFEMITEIHDMDIDLAKASRLESTNPSEAVREADNALNISTSIWKQRNQVLQNAVATWDRSWFPRVADAHGRHSLHELDDVKDHLADRTLDMTYLVYREKLLSFGTWVDSIVTARNQFAMAHHLSTRAYILSWDDFSVASATCSSAATTCNVGQ
ncbi:MAG: glycoside hydrolase family 20 zincin-like fold domain-containing protein [Sulfobacillus sp.]